MGYMNEFPHSRMFDSDLREIVELYLTVKDLPKTWETYKQMLDTEFAELKAFVNDYFDNLNVQNEINKKLDSMVKDGTMSNIIRPIFNEFNQVLHDIKKDTNITKKLIKNMPVINTELADYYVQGSCYDSKRNRVVMYSVKRDGTNGKIFILNDDFNITDSIEVSLGHGNDMTYNAKADKYYSINDTYIYTIDADTFETTHIDIGFTVHCIEWIEKLNLYFLSDNTNVYLLSESFDIIYQSTLSTLLPSAIDIVNFIGQGSFSINNSIYILFDEKETDETTKFNILIRLDIESSKFVYISVNKYRPSQVYSEIESGFLIDDNAILLSWSNEFLQFEKVSGLLVTNVLNCKYERPILLAEGTDLNEIVTPGDYFANHTNIVNCPLKNQTFTMRVSINGNNGIYQLVEFDNTRRGLALRRYSATSCAWSRWCVLNPSLQADDSFTAYMYTCGFMDGAGTLHFSVPLNNIYRIYDQPKVESLTFNKMYANGNSILSSDKEITSVEIYNDTVGLTLIVHDFEDLAYTDYRSNPVGIKIKLKVSTN